MTLLVPWVLVSQVMFLVLVLQYYKMVVSARNNIMSDSMKCTVIEPTKIEWADSLTAYIYIYIYIYIYQRTYIDD